MSGATRRDQGLRRVSRLTRWVGAGALAGVGFLSAVAAHALPGRSQPAPQPPPNLPVTTPVPDSPSIGDSSDPSGAVTPLAPPARAPVASRSQPVVASGSS